MNRAEYQIALQHNKSSLFAKVTLSISLTEHYKREIIFLNADKQWRAAVEFGIQYAYEQILFKLPQNAKGSVIQIEQILSHAADTTEMAMVFASAMATWKALNIYPNQMPQYDRELKNFIFPG